jgi:hypothetical protein
VDFGAKLEQAGTKLQGFFVGVVAIVQKYRR